MQPVLFAILTKRMTMLKTSSRDYELQIEHVRELSRFPTTRSRDLDNVGGEVDASEGLLTFAGILGVQVARENHVVV